MKRKQTGIALLCAGLLAGSVCLGGCETTKTATSDASTQTVATTDTTTDTEQLSADTSDLPIDVSDVFTSRDLENSYDETDCVDITLTGESAACSASGVSIDGGTVTITKAGTYRLSGTLSDGMILVNADSSDKIQLVLNGVDITNSTSAAIYVAQADKVFLTTVSGTENSLTNGGSYVQIDDNNIDAVIFSKDDLTLNGEGSLTITATAGHGIVSKDDLVITAGTYVITADEHALSGKDSIRIAGGSYTISCGEDAIHSENDDEDEKGYVYIAGGVFEIAAGDDGIHAGYAVMITAGEINITTSYEGIEGLSIDILGGTISLVASDDGLNAAGGNDSSGFGGYGESIFAVTDGAYIRISGGTLDVSAGGDGIDSNGDLSVSGGTITISGPANSGNGSLDYNGTAQITGGTVMAVEASTSMAENFGSTSTQGSILVAASGSESVSLTNSAGEVLLSLSPNRSFGAVLLSCPDLVQGETYTLSVDGTEMEITLDSLIYTSGSSMGGMNQGNMPHGASMQGGRNQPAGMNNRR